jgi:hypothetical protein
MHLPENKVNSLINFNIVKAKVFRALNSFLSNRSSQELEHQNKFLKDFPSLLKI